MVNTTITALSPTCMSTIRVNNWASPMQASETLGCQMNTLTKTRSALSARDYYCQRVVGVASVNLNLPNKDRDNKPLFSTPANHGNIYIQRTCATLRLHNLFTRRGDMGLIIDVLDIADGLL